MPGKINKAELLVRAILKRDLPRVRSIIDMGFNVNKEIAWKQSDVFTALGSAISNDALEIAKYLIEVGADVDQGPGKWTPLMTACGSGRLEFVDLLLQASADVNIQTKGGPKPERGKTALILAAARGDLEIVKRLLAAGADPKSETATGCNALTGAARARTDNVELAKTLVEAGCPVRGNAVLGAVMSGHLKMMKYLLKAGGDPDYVDDGRDYGPMKGYTPLSTAIVNGRTEIALELINAGANPDLPMSDYLPPLCSAAFHGNIEVVKALLKAGADKEALNMVGYTPLGSAAEMGHLEVAKVLLAAGANPDGHGCDQNGKDAETPSELARRKGHVEILRLLEGSK